jgi:hypothetical protein
MSQTQTRSEVKMRILPAIVVLLATAVSAQANCSATQVATSRALFANSGAFATKGPAGMTIVNCPLEGGWYAEVFALTPFQKFDIGKEVDVKLGWNTSFGPWGINAFLASYRFSTGAALETVLDGRLRAEYKFELGSGSAFLPYAGIDLSRSLSTGADNHSLFGGVVWQVKLTERIGWNTDAALWHHLNWSAAHGLNPNVWSITTGPSIQLDDKWSMKFDFIHTVGGVEIQGHNKSAISAGLTVKF